MKKWEKIKNTLDIFKDNLLLEMSKYRQASLNSIMGTLIPLLTHLIIVYELGSKDREYKKHSGEIQDYQNLIQGFNKKGKNKIWFTKGFINEVSKDQIKLALKKVKEKYPKLKIKNQYLDLNSFKDFDIFDPLSLEKKDEKISK